MPKKKEIKENISERQALIEKVMSDVNKSLGTNAISRAEDFNGSFLLRRPTGIMSLDIELKGGFPRGIVEINGESSAGKTHLACEVAKEVQKNYGDESCIGLFMAEKFDKEYWKKIGLKIAFSDEEIKSLEKARSKEFTEEQKADYKSQIGEIHINQSIIAEEVFEAILIMLESGLYQLIVIDSLGVLMTNKQDEGDVGDKYYGGITLPLQMFLNKASKINTNTTIIIINHLKDNLKMKNEYDDPFKEYGGNALKYHKFVSLRLFKSSNIKKVIGSSEFIVGRMVRWVIKKGKAGMSDGATGDYPVYRGKHGFDFGIDKEQDLIKVALEFDIIEKAGAWFSYAGERLGQGIDNAAKTLKNMVTFKKEIFDKCLKESKIDYVLKD